MAKSGFTMKYASYRGPHPSRPASEHIAFWTRDLATDLTPSQRRQGEKMLAAALAMVETCGAAGGCN